MNRPFLTLGEFLALAAAQVLLGAVLYFTYKPEAELGPLCDVENAEQCSCKIPEPPRKPFPWENPQ